MQTKQMTVTAEEIQSWKTGKQDTITSGVNATGTGNVVLAVSPALTGTPTVPTASVGTNTTQAASTAYVKAEIVSTTPSTIDISNLLSTPTLNSNFYRGVTNLGGDLKFITLGLSVPGANNYSLTSGTASFIPIQIDYSTTISTVRFTQLTQGSYTANNFNGVALYSYSAGTLTQVAISANTGTLWQASGNAAVDIVFTSPYSAAAGIYYVGILYCSSAQTTAPAILAGAVGNSSIVAFFGLTNSAKFCGYLGGQTTLQSSIALSSITALSSNILIGVK